MTDKTEKKYNSSIEYLIDQIELFLTNNPTISAEGFGWFSIKDASVVRRLRNGGDITTRKMDKIIAYLSNPHT